MSQWENGGALVGGLLIARFAELPELHTRMCWLKKLVYDLEKHCSAAGHGITQARQAVIESRSLDPDMIVVGLCFGGHPCKTDQSLQVLGAHQDLVQDAKRCCAFCKKKIRQEGASVSEACSLACGGTVAKVMHWAGIFCRRRHVLNSAGR